MEGAIVALASAVFSVPALVLTFGLLWSIDRDLSTMRPWLDSGLAPSPLNALGYLSLLGVELALAVGLAWFVERCWGEVLVGPLLTKRASAWQHVAKDLKDKVGASEVMLDIWLTDGTVVCGVVDVYTPDLAKVDREIVLKEPITHRRADGSALYERSVHSFVVPGESVVAMSVRYLLS